MEVTVK